jgi:hypothetical protein
MQNRLLTATGCLLLAALSIAGPAPAGPPAAIPQDDVHRRTLRSFERFASRWMEKMERVEAHNREKPEIRPLGSRNLITYRGYGGDFTVEIKPTGYAPAPFVGVLRYSEQLYACADARATRCRLTATTPVTEIFRFQNGRWVY